MANKPIKLLYHGDSPAVATGFGNVSRLMLGALKKKHPEIDITVLGINDRGGYKDPEKYPYKIYPAIWDDYRDLFGLKRLLSILAKEDPEVKEDFDVVLFNWDFYLLNEIKIGRARLIDLLRQVLPHTTVRKIIQHSPVDHELIKPEWGESLMSFDELLVPSYFGKRAYENFDKDMGRRTKVIYHGFESDVFYPMAKDKKEKLRAEFGMKDKFVVGFVGRNSWRKDFYRIVSIFAEFKKKHPEAFLYLHTKPVEMEFEGLHIFELCEQFGLKLQRDYLVPAGDFNENIGVPRQDMNNIYNFMDVQLWGTVGEGFGMPLVESMLAGVPNIAPNNSTIPEILNFDKTNFDVEDQIKAGRGLVYKTNNTAMFGKFDHQRARPLGDIDDGLEKLEWLYNNRDKAQPMIDRAQEWAETLTNEKMAEEFYESIKLKESDIPFNKRKKPEIMTPNRSNLIL